MILYSTFMGMITYDMSQTYESRHVKEFLGLDKNQLFHWTQTKKLMRPIYLGEGRGGRSKFSLDDLLTLALIMEINSFGVELNTIKKIMMSFERVEFPSIGYKDDGHGNRDEVKSNKFALGASIWDYYRTDREFFSRFGYSLEISSGLRKPYYKRMLEREGKISGAIAKKLRHSWFLVRALDGKSQLELLKKAIDPSERSINWSWRSDDVVIVINLLRIIKSIELKTKRTV